MKKNLKGKVLNIECVAKETVKLQFSTPLREICPGQFVSILIPNKTLRRPFSVAGFSSMTAFSFNVHSSLRGKRQRRSNPEKLDGEVSCCSNPVNPNDSAVITVLFKLKGDGTNYLKSLKIGDDIDYLAPLGNCFTLPETGKKALLIGAGIGIAPMLYLKKVLADKGVENLLISGFKDEEEVVKGSDRTVIGGSVLDNIQDVIDEFKPDIIYSCGPKIVLELVCKLAERNGLAAEIAMEKVMACGIGVCRGCVIKVRDELKGGGAVKNASVCADGPVFSGAEVIWE